MINILLMCLWELLEYIYLFIYLFLFLFIFGR
jgi:hypothetical protein